MSFREMEVSLREDSAKVAFRRAMVAGKMAHVAAKESSRRKLHDIKTREVQRAMELAPDRIEIGVDRDFLVGQPNVRWRGVGRMHLSLFA